MINEVKIFLIIFKKMAGNLTLYIRDPPHTRLCEKRFQFKLSGVELNLLHLALLPFTTSTKPSQEKRRKEKKRKEKKRKE